MYKSPHYKYSLSSAWREKNQSCVKLWRISVKARHALWLRSGLPTRFLRRGCLIGSLELTQSLSGAAFLDITWRFTSLVGCLSNQDKNNGVSTEIPVLLVSLQFDVRHWLFSQTTRKRQGRVVFYLKYIRENSFRVAGANRSTFPVSFWLACMTFFLWFGDKVSSFCNKQTCKNLTLLICPHYKSGKKYLPMVTPYHNLVSGFAECW